MGSFLPGTHLHTLGSVHSDFSEEKGTRGQWFYKLVKECGREQAASAHSLSSSPSRVSVGPMMASCELG